MKKKVLSIVLCIVMLLSLMSTVAFAADIASGSGWKIDSAGTLHLTGKITNFSDQYDNYVPWKAHAPQIKKVVAEKGSSVSNGRFLFMDCNNLVSADLSQLSCPGLTDIYRLFSGCESLTSVNLNGADLSHVTNVGSMFNGCSSLKSVDLSALTNAPITEAVNMFSKCASLPTVNLSPLKNAKIEDIGGMFSYCTSLTSVDLSVLNTENLHDFAYTFRECTSLKTIDLSALKNNPKLNTMQGAFESCSALETINLVGFDTSHVKVMLNLFSGCSSLKEIDLTGFNTSNVVEAYWMFKDCASLKSLDLSGFDTRKMVRMEDLTEGCTNLEELDVSTFRFEDDIHYGIHNFKGCDSLKKISISVPHLRNLAEELIGFSPIWTNADTGEVYQSRKDLMFITSEVTLLKGNEHSGDGWLLDSAGCLNITGEIKNPSDSADATPWKDYKDQIKSVVAHPGARISNFSYLFYGCRNLTSVDLSKMTHVSSVTLNYTFAQCRNLRTVDMSSIESLWRSATTAFNNTSTLREITATKDAIRMMATALNGISPSWLNVASKEICEITELNAFSGKNVVTLTRFAKYLTNEWYIDQNGGLHITSSVTNDTVAGGQDSTPWTAYKGEITSVVVGNNARGIYIRNTAGKDNYRSLFSGCTNLTTVDLSKLKISNVATADVGYMLQNCKNLSEITADGSLIAKAANELLGLSKVWYVKGSGTAYSSVSALQSLTGTVTLTKDGPHTHQIYILQNLAPDETSVHGTISISPKGPYMPGTKITVTGNPDEGYHFYGIGEPISTGLVITNNSFIMPDDDVWLMAAFGKHRWDKGVVTTPATFTSEGVKTFTCSCGATRTESVPKLERSEVKSVSIDDVKLNYKSTAVVTPTIEKSGNVEYIVAYTSSNPKVVTVDNNGNIKGTKAWGRKSATITCTVTDEFKNVVTDTCTVTCGYTWWQWLIGIFLFGFIWY